MPKLITILFGFLITFSAFAEPVLYTSVNQNSPEIGKINNVYVGDRMLYQATGKWIECITPTQLFQSEKIKGQLGTYAVYEPVKMCNQSPRPFYLPDYVNQERKGKRLPGGSIFPVVWTPNGNESSLCLCADKEDQSCEKKKGCLTGLTEDAVIQEPVFEVAFDNLQRTIEYVGKNGPLLKFIYSEYYEDRIRDAFTREFQLDLGEGNVGAFKGAVFEVLKADNMSIEYKVVRNFTE